MNLITEHRLYSSSICCCWCQNLSPPCGITRVDDLGKKDQKMLTTLAHLELMMLFDECSITYGRKKTKRKGSGSSFSALNVFILKSDRVVVASSAFWQPQCFVPCFYSFFLSSITQKVRVRFRESWGIGRLWTGEELI